MKKQMIFVVAVLMIVFLVACGRENVPPENETNTDSTETGEQENTEMKLRIDVGESTFTATLENNEAAAVLAEMLEDESLIIEMNDYAGFEKVGSLGTSLPASNSQMTTRAGDIVLYNSSQIVMFYGSNSWSYTKLAEVDDLTGWEDALGSGSVTVTLSTE